MGATSKYFPQISTFTVSGAVLEETLSALRAEGKFRVESLVFWGGSVKDSVAVVTHVFVPKGRGVAKHPLQVRIDDRVMAALCGQLDPPRLLLLGQVHTHKATAFHSPSDDRFSLDTPGYLSIVIPEFARAGVSERDEWAFYECQGVGRFRAIDSQERARRFLFTTDGAVTVDDVFA